MMSLGIYTILSKYFNYLHVLTTGKVIAKPNYQKPIPISSYGAVGVAPFAKVFSFQIKNIALLFVFQVKKT